MSRIITRLLLDGPTGQRAASSMASPAMMAAGQQNPSRCEPPRIASIARVSYKPSMPVDPLAALGLTESERQLLLQHSFEAATFLALRAELAAGRFPPERNMIQGAIAPPADSDFLTWPGPGSARAAAYERLGNQALSQGQVAVAILNGGMATRFGGRVKGVVEVTDGWSFLGLRLRDVANAPGPVPVFLMNSFATSELTLEHLDQHDWFHVDRARVHLLTQRIAVRLTPSGDWFRDKAGRLSFYAPGHGDVFEVLGGCPAFREFADQGGRVVVVSNVDNVAATLHPRVIGAHLHAGQLVTAEVAARAAGDAGGAPVRLLDRVVVLEGFRFPKGFDMASIPVFNTNTLILDVRAVRSDYDLTWFRADKQVDGQPVVQFERLMGEVTSFVPATYLTVPRDGPEGRFLPVKTPADLEALRTAIRQRFLADSNKQ